MCQKLTKISFAFAGRGDLASELQKIENIHDVGFQMQDTLKSLIKNAKFVVVPSEWYEPFGLSVAETISLGTPVIASNIAGIAEIVSDGINGILFESGNVDELEKIIRLLWENEELLNNLKNNCKGYCPIYLGEYCQMLRATYE